MAIALNSENYPALNESILTTIKSGKYATISVFTNSEGTIYASDSHGQIKDRAVMSASYTASYKDKDGVDTNPFVVIKFRDEPGKIYGTFIDYFTTVDYVDDHWYVLGEVNVPQFSF